MRCYFDHLHYHTQFATVPKRCCISINIYGILCSVNVQTTDALIGHSLSFVLWFRKIHALFTCLHWLLSYSWWEFHQQSFGRSAAILNCEANAIFESLVSTNVQSCLYMYLYLIQADLFGLWRSKSHCGHCSSSVLLWYFLISVHVHSCVSVILLLSEILGGDKVSILTHTYPHKPLTKIKRSSAVTNWPDVWSGDVQTLQMCMVIHDTKCPYWDQISLLNNTNSVSNFT